MQQRMNPGMRRVHAFQDTLVAQHDGPCHTSTHPALNKSAVWLQVKAYVMRQFSKILGGRVSLQDFVFCKEVR